MGTLIENKVFKKSKIALIKASLVHNLTFFKEKKSEWFHWFSTLKNDLNELELCNVSGGCWQWHGIVKKMLIFTRFFCGFMSDLNQKNLEQSNL